MTYETTVRIRADFDSAWQAVCGCEFERDFLPEVAREGLSSERWPSQAPCGQITWRNGADVSIQMRRRDLNVHIESVQIALNTHRDGVRVTIRVSYRKPLEKRFFKAVCAVRHLFRYKLEVLKHDLERRECNPILA